LTKEEKEKEKQMCSIAESFKRKTMIQ